MRNFIAGILAALVGAAPLGAIVWIVVLRHDLIGEPAVLPVQSNKA
jgi:hypothetical protein